MNLNNTRVIGLTGGIGTGKSTAAAYLKSKGLAHVDADEIGRQLTADNSPLLLKLEKSFSDAVIRGEGGISLNRAALAEQIFKDAAKKACLDSIMFKAIITEIDKKIQEYKWEGEYSHILLDAPLLFEAGLESRCDVVILLIADEEKRIHRVCSRDGVRPSQVKERIKSQLTDEEKIMHSHIVIDNSYGEEELYNELDKILINNLQIFKI